MEKRIEELEKRVAALEEKKQEQQEEEKFIREDSNGKYNERGDSRLRPNCY